MKSFLPVLLFSSLLNLSCQSQQRRVLTNIAAAQTSNETISRPSISPTPSPISEAERYFWKKPTGSEHNPDEAETPQGKVKVWTKTFRAEGSDKLKTRDELYYQIGNTKPVLIAKTRWYDSFSNLTLSPNGKWLLASFSYKKSSGSDSAALLINLKYKDFFEDKEIYRKLDKLRDYVTDAPSDSKVYGDKLFSAVNWQEGKPATVISNSPGVNESIALPDKMPTPRQDLYQALEFND